MAYYTTVAALTLSLLMVGSPTPPQAKDEQLRQELLRRVRADQDARKAVMALLRGDPAAGKKDSPVVKRLGEIDRENTVRMTQIVKEHGWPGKSLVGTDGAQAAWLLVQHADRDRPFQKLCLGLLREAVKKGEATGQQLAYLTDRVRVGEKEKQVYGTQLRLVDGKYQPHPLEDEANVDRRRKEVGLPPLAEYLRFAEKALTAGKKSP